MKEGISCALGWKVAADCECQSIMHRCGAGEAQGGSAGQPVAQVWTTAGVCGGGMTDMIGFLKGDNDSTLKIFLVSHGW